MVYKLLYKPDFYKALDKIDSRDQKRIIAGMEKLRDNFENCDIKKLKGLDAWRYRIGNYRVLFRLEPESGQIIIILVLTVGHRKDIYKDI